MPFTIQCASENVLYLKVIFVLYKEHSVLVFTSSEYCTKLECEYLASDILHTYKWESSTHDCRSSSWH